MFLVETGESRTPRPKGPLVGYATGLSGALFLALGSLRRRNHPLASRFVFRLRLSAFRRLHPGLLAPASPPPGIAGSRRSRCYAASANSRSPVNGCHLINEGDGTSACNPPRNAPVEPTRPHNEIYISIFSQGFYRVNGSRTSCLTFTDRSWGIITRWD